jgi:hypothetical protein
MAAAVSPGAGGVTAPQLPLSPLSSFITGAVIPMDGGRVIQRSLGWAQRRGAR